MGAGNVSEPHFDYRNVDEKEGGPLKCLTAPLALIWNNGTACVAINALLAAAQGLFVKLVNDRLPVFQVSSFVPAYIQAPARASQFDRSLYADTREYRSVLVCAR